MTVYIIGTGFIYFTLTNEASTIWPILVDPAALRPVWKVCIARRISPARNFDAFYIITIKFLKSPERNFQTFQSGPYAPINVMPDPREGGATRGIGLISLLLGRGFDLI